MYAPYLPVPPQVPMPPKRVLVTGSVAVWLLLLAPPTFGVTLVVLIVLAIIDLAGHQPKRYHRALAEWQAYEDHRRAVIDKNAEIFADNERARLDG